MLVRESSQRPHRHSDDIIEFSRGWQSSRQRKRDASQSSIRRKHRQIFEQGSSRLFRYVIFRLQGVLLIESPNKSLEYLSPVESAFSTSPPPWSSCPVAFNRSRESSPSADLAMVSNAVLF